MRIYIAGPMRGIPLYNFPAFDAAAAKLWSEGHEVVSPADMDRESGLHPETLPADFDWNDVPSGFSAKAAFRRDMDELLRCDAIALLPGWRESYGATVEADVAKLVGLQRIEFADKEKP